MENGTNHPYLYRVLRSGEDPKAGLSPKNEHSGTSVCEHVSSGSKRYASSRYISTCAYFETAKNFARLGMRKRNNSQKTIVKIDVEKLKKVSGVKFIDLTKPSNKTYYLGGDSDAQKYASQWDEVLIEGFVPADCIVDTEKVTQSAPAFSSYMDWDLMDSSNSDCEYDSDYLDFY